MGKTIYPVEISRDASSGSWSFNTLPVQAGVCRHILIACTSSDTTFDFKIIDESDNVIYDTERREKTAQFVLDDEVCLPMRGIYTLKVYNASSDDTFTGRLMVVEV